MRGDCGVAGEGRVVGVPKFHSWCKCTMPLTNINTEIGCPTLLLACELYCYISCIWGCNLNKTFLAFMKCKLSSSVCPNKVCHGCRVLICY